MVTPSLGGNIERAFDIAKAKGRSPAIISES